MQNLTSTKFIFATMSVIMAFVLVLLNKVDSAQFLTFVAVTGSTYILGNVASKFVKNDSAD